MFFTLSKILDVAFSPLAWSFGWLVTAAVLAQCKRGLGAQRCLVLGIATLYVFSSGTVAWWLGSSLTAVRLPRARPEERFDAVILLGGYAGPPLAGDRFPQFAAGVDRLFKALDLYRSGRARVILVSGGAVIPPPESDFVVDALLELGVAREHLVQESKSLNTHENARFARPIVERAGWRRLALVTSATHALRAYQTFRAEGLEVKVFPTDSDGAPPKDLYEALCPRAAHLEHSERVLRELFGLVVYRLRGYAKP